MNNGLNRIEFHITDQAGHGSHATHVAGIAKAVPHELPLQKLDYDAAARHHLAAILAAPVPHAIVAAPATPAPDLDFEGIEELALTNTVVSRYQVRYRSIPVYGATLGVEMDHNKDLVGISGSLESRIDVDPVATVSPAAARDIVKRLARVEPHEPLDATDAPELMYRFDQPTGTWHLAYVFEGVTVYQPSIAPAESKERARPYRFFIDAHSGEELARVPMQATVTVDATGTGAGERQDSCPLN
jgi:hypothetical protein